MKKNKTKKIICEENQCKIEVSRFGTFSSYILFQPFFFQHTKILVHFLFLSLFCLLAQLNKYFTVCSQYVRIQFYPVLCCVYIPLTAVCIGILLIRIGSHQSYCKLLHHTLIIFFCCSLASIAHTHTRIAFFVDISLEIRCGRCLSVLFIFFLLLLTSSEKDKNQFRN